MEIIIYDNAGISQTLDFEFRKISSKNLYVNVLSEIKKIVKFEFEKISELLPKSQNLKIKISLEAENKTESSTKLASFDVELSSETEFIFHIYFSSIKQLANKLLKLDYDEKQSIENTILHELIHAIDLNTLKETYLIEIENIKPVKRPGITFISDVELSSHNNNVQWAFLNYFTTFRNEGVAILGEKLLGTSKNSFEKQDIYKCLDLFQHDISVLIEEASDLFFHSEIENHKLYKRLDELYLNAYSYADAVLLFLISFLNKDIEFVRLKAQQHIFDRTKNELSKSDIHNLLKAAMDIDLSEFINGIIRYPFLNKDKELICRKKFFECCAIIQDENLEMTNDGITLFSKTIAAIGYNQSHDSFISAMRATVGSPMSIPEIKELYQGFKDKKFKEDIVDSVKVMADFLLPIAVDNNDEIAIWALTYLFDDEDLIHDDISILGWQDDWLVLNASLTIINFRRQNVEKQ
jgi:hypothetical protein